MEVLSVTHFDLVLTCSMMFENGSDETLKGIRIKLHTREVATKHGFISVSRDLWRVHMTAVVTTVVGPSEGNNNSCYSFLRTLRCHIQQVFGYLYYGCHRKCIQ